MLRWWCWSGSRPSPSTRPRTTAGWSTPGLYYAPGSLKARLCRRGLGLLRSYCTERGLPYEACGKVVVAVDEGEVEPLRRLEERATANGVPGLRWLEQRDLAKVEPHVTGVAGLHSPETAIADFAAVARAFAADVTAGGRRDQDWAPRSLASAENGGRRAAASS